MLRGWCGKCATNRAFDELNAVAALFTVVVLGVADFFSVRSAEEQIDKVRSLPPAKTLPVLVCLRQIHPPALWTLVPLRWQFERPLSLPIAVLRSSAWLVLLLVTKSGNHWRNSKLACAPSRRRCPAAGVLGALSFECFGLLGLECVGSVFGVFWGVLGCLQVYGSFRGLLAACCGVFGGVFWGVLRCVEVFWGFRCDGVFEVFWV